MPDITVEVLLETPVTVAYKRRGGQYHCTALQFDLLGLGRTKKEAFAALQDIVASYIALCLENSDKNPRFFNPSPAEEWNVPDRHTFQVSMTALLSNRPMKNPPRAPRLVSDLAHLRKYRKASNFRLVPLGN